MKACFVVIVALLMARGVDAQPTGAWLRNVVNVSDNVLVTTTDGSRLSGRVRSLTEASLTVDTRDGPQTLPANRIGRIVVKDPIRNGLLIGLGIGAGVGVTGGLLVNAICVNETGGCPGTVLLLTGIGAAAGAGIGAGLDGLRHRTTFDILPDAPHEYAPELFANVGVGRSQMSGLSLTGAPSAGASFAMRHTSGLGFALDVTRTTGRSTRDVACAESTPSNASCNGGGQEGVVDTTIASARAQYYFSHSRVQPYVSGGAAIYQDSLSFVLTARPFPSGAPVTYQALNRSRGLALVVGGGVRIALNKRLSFRPDVTIYKDSRWTHVRPSVGFGVGW